jgi:hypothetical protein
MKVTRSVLLFAVVAIASSVSALVHLADDTFEAPLVHAKR